MFSRIDIQDLVAIQKDVYSRFTYTTDLKQYGVEEEWADIPPELLSSGPIVGDCDDFARICMLKAQAWGFNARLVFCRVEGEGHLICEVADREFCQAFYFDNMQETLVNFRPIRKYEFVSTSAWNPARGKERHWLHVDQRALDVRVKAFG